TRFSRDWSSDVCSSDLGEADEPATVPSVSAQGVARGGARWPPGQRSSAQAGRVDRLGSAIATRALLQGRTHAPPASGRHPGVRADGPVERPARGVERKDQYPDSWG